MSKVYAFLSELRKTANANISMAFQLFGIPTETLSKLVNRTAKARESEVYVRKEITGLAGFQLLFRPSTPSKVGTININNAKLPSGENHFFDNMFVRYAKDGSETDSAKLKYTNVVSANLDPALRNAIIRVKQGSRLLVERTLSSFFSETAVPYPSGSKENGPIFDTVQYLIEEEAFEISIEFPEGQTVDATAKHHIEVVIPGLTTVQR